MPQTREWSGSATFGLPNETALVTGANPGGNKLYVDLRGQYNWSDARKALVEDRALVRHFQSLIGPYEMRWEAAEALAARKDLDTDDYWNGDFKMSPFSFLDVGIASSVVALIALGGAPIISCNGGVFDDPHFHPHPLIAFYAPRDAEPTVLAAARYAKLRLEQNDFTRSPMLAAERVQPFIRFAAALCRTHAHVND